MMEIAAIGNLDTITGFRLAGIRRVYLEDDAKNSLKDLANDEEIGIILITEKFADKNKDQIENLNKRKKGTAPIIVEIPDNTGPMERESDPIKELMRKAVGVEIE